MTTDFSIQDSVNAWVPHGRFVIEGASHGPLSGLRFAAKDLFDVAGHPTGAGNPVWLDTHALPTRHSALVERLLAAGATLTGKVITDELAYSIHGDNAHYGMPINSAAPDRIPGGSSSGSVAAVAAGLVDFALGTDTGGSTRVPGSYCGVWGLRPTHGLLPVDGLVPLHPAYDTPTWLARDARTFLRVGETLLPPSSLSPQRALALSDTWSLAEESFQPLLKNVFALLSRSLRGESMAVAGEEGLDAWRQIYVTSGAFEGWQAHGEWISTHEPRFAPAIASRWTHAASVTAEQADEAVAQRSRIRQHVRDLLGYDAVAVVPSAASVAPLRSAGGAEIDDIRMRTLRICCVAGLAGLPQVTMPFRTREGLPAGVSLIGPAGSDLALIRLAVALHAALA
ncbi:MAG: amidase [Rhodocyclaceae bacterium]